MEAETLSTTELEQLISPCDEAVALRPRDPEGYKNRGAAYRQAGVFDKAIADFNMVVELAPSDAGSHLLLAEVHQAAGDARNAMLEYEKALEIDPHNQQAQRESKAVAGSIVAGASVGADAMVRFTILRQTRSWATWLLVMGVVQLVANSFLDPGWGIVLIAVGAASLYLRSLAMLPVYGVTMAWAAVSNLAAREIWWSGFALLQFYWAFSVFRQFLSLRGVATRMTTAALGGMAPRGASGRWESPIEPVVGPDRASKVFPWAGCALSGVAGVALIAVLVGFLVYTAISEGSPGDAALRIGLSLPLNMGVLGLALGVATVLMRYRYSVVGLLAIIGGGVLLAGFLALIILGR
jgi:hypothetical protein